MQYTKEKYPDGSFYMEITSFEDPIIRERINNYSDLWMIAQLKDICDHNKVKVHLEIPCLLDAQADVRFESNQSSNMKLMCEFLRRLNFESITIFHPHNLSAVEAYLPDALFKSNFGFIKDVLEDLEDREFDPTESILMSTDAGSYKTVMKLADKLKWEGEVIAASKARAWVKGESILTQLLDRDDFDGKDVLIVDDLCVYGGTFLGLSKMLRERNAGRIYLAVSHMTVSNPNVLLDVAFDHIFSTNSKYNDVNLKNLTLYHYF